MKRMVRLIYASRMAGGVVRDDLNDILETSRRKNEKFGITGVLCYAPAGFLQCLEGPADSVNQLYNNIIRDDRHIDVTLLEYSEIDQRCFAKWAMAYVRADEVDSLILRKYSAQNAFDPFAMNAKQALGFLVETAAERETRLAK